MSSRRVDPSNWASFAGGANLSIRGANVPLECSDCKFYRPKKQSVSIRLDADILVWLKASGEGYQTRVNTYLPCVNS